MKKVKELLARFVASREVNAAGSFASDQTLRLNFRNTPLRVVLDYLRKSGGLVIEVRPNVTVSEKVDAFNDQLLSCDEALNLLEKVLHKQHCTLIQNGGRVVIMQTEDAKKSYIPIRLAGNHLALLKKPASSGRLFTPAASSWSN